MSRPHKYDDEVIWVRHLRSDAMLADSRIPPKQVPEELNEIQAKWRALTLDEGDSGCCVLGEGMMFKYNDKWYFMPPNSHWQGEGSWLPHVDTIKSMLTEIGATDIVWECGVLD